MVKGKVAKAAFKGAQSVAKTRGGKGAGVVAATQVADEVLDNPYAQAGIGAIEGAALGAAFGVPGAIAGGLVGGTLGFLMADGDRIAPVDLVAIPAYQYSAMLQGREPTFQLYIKEGELITPTKPTDAMEGEMILDTVQEAVVSRKPRKLNSWQRYIKNKKNHIKFKSGKNKGKLNLKAMGRAFRKGIVTGKLPLVQCLVSFPLP